MKQLPLLGGFIMSCTTHRLRLFCGSADGDAAAASSSVNK